MGLWVDLISLACAGITKPRALPWEASPENIEIYSDIDAGLCLLPAEYLWRQWVLSLTCSFSSAKRLNGICQCSVTPGMVVAGRSLAVNQVPVWL